MNSRQRRQRRRFAQRLGIDPRVVRSVARWADAYRQLWAIAGTQVRKKAEASGLPNGFTLKEA